MTNVVDFSSARSQVASGGDPPDNGGMEIRIAKLESIAEKTGERLASLERDIAIIRSNYATREDLHKAINDQTWKIIGTMVTFGTLLSGIVFFIARNVR